jgi:hypothetical protein
MIEANQANHNPNAGIPDRRNQIIIGHVRMDFYHPTHKAIPLWSLPTLPNAHQ